MSIEILCLLRIHQVPEHDHPDPLRACPERLTEGDRADGAFQVQRIKRLSPPRPPAAIVLTPDVRKR